jgi:hypothetical protein
MKKSGHMRVCVAQENGVSAAHLLSSLLRLVKRRITVVHLLEKSVINMI